MGSLLIEEQESPTKPSKPQFKSKQTHLSDRFSISKNIDFSKWVSKNTLKIFAFILIALTVAALFFLLSAGDPTALLCFRNQKPPMHQQKIQLPEIHYNSIPPIVDKSSPLASFRSRQWIVVSVSDYPTDALRSLVKMKGWQVLAVGNSRTPEDWELKGAIFLSMEQQGNSGFRIVDYLPYDSYVRKSVGYLFAIQHGAKKIFDADDRGEVIGGDLGKIFDLDLKDAVAKQQRVLQYTNVVNANRTVVNPYIHFGQRSVWPRGLPLENVGEVEHEEFYNEVNGGTQYIQQGISNGLPDVDSVFYSTRKSGEETFDINFDEHAPKVSLPQGIMVPMNSFNSMFHYNAFWALMLPVSVSTMASDVLRGYWGQRLLWEIGGNAMVYPPTIRRPDKTEAYPFSEEKDLHVNVGRLAKFLISWRSGKQMLSDKMLELSYLMAEKEFWTEKDVKFTSAWIQDLIAVGYLQPRLMAVDLDRQSTSVGDADRREFIPRKLPSVHLGVEESGTVNYEIGNLIRWRRNFGNIVLILFVSGPVERTALEWRLLYGRIFKTVIILSMQADVDLAIEQSQLDQVYKYLPKLFNRFPNAEGFLFLQDDTVLNYWNLVQADKTKLWTTNKVPESWTNVSTAAGNSSSWFSQQSRMVRKVVSTMPVHFQVNYKESGPGKKTLTLSDSEVFYIPRPFVSDFIDLVNLVGDLEIHHKVAIPMFFLSMDSPRNFDPVFNKMVYETQAKSSNPSLVLYSAQVPAVHPWSVSSEPEFVKLIRLMAIGDPLLMELF